MPPPDARRRGHPAEIPGLIIWADNPPYDRMHGGRPIFPIAGLNIAYEGVPAGRNIAQAARADRRTTSISLRRSRLTCVALSQNGARHSTSNSSADGS